MNINGSVVLVTGANGGIGRAFVSELLARGASKVYLGVRNVHSVDDLLSTSDKLVALQLDVTRPEQVAEAAKVASDINVLINNAGTATFTGALSTNDVSGARVEMEVNYFGVMALSQALKDTPAFRSGGAIINILSILSHVTLPVAGTYSASKAAALHLTRTMRAELKSRGVPVIAVMPVQTDTALGAALPEPKLTPREVAVGALDALAAGEEDVFPGELSKATAQAFKDNPAGVQAYMANLVHAIA
ncbi:SDR family NAD(P)-dependent oxidoreductase [Pararobbsia silviterrae]|uniref:SDR family NAD(P)-dependent oxidoreductase n=1 Tax=Pararobbsia silviterrae TaxID=1792498 RepID=A0A494XPW2_9BURK|nr:SDR family NAD(P)-dependent oxidoreductase [Pararobbsia silviterrae]RKP49573.1 SDR family NAD(P)-dependent oxidoreductase [Pararobbsia silviterrae]